MAIGACRTRTGWPNNTIRYNTSTIQSLLNYHPQYPLNLPKITPKQTFLAGNPGSVDAGEIPPGFLLISLAPLPRRAWKALLDLPG